MNPETEAENRNSEVSDLQKSQDNSEATINKEQSQNNIPVMQPQEVVAHNSFAPEAGPSQPSYPPQFPQGYQNQPYVAAVPPPEKHNDYSAGLLVLEWLTYAFWGWLVLVLSIMTSLLITFFFEKTSTESVFIYFVAAILVLLPLAFVTDSLYGKKEPTKKTGAAMAIMVIHAVIFAVCAIAALITTVFSLVSMFVGSGSGNAPTIGIMAGLITFLFYVLTFARTLNIASLPVIKSSYRFIMLGLVGIIVLISILGPITFEKSVSNDKLIEKNLYALSDGVENYARENRELPQSLNELDFSGDAKKLVDEKLVEYKPNTTPNGSRSRSSSTLFFELCANFKAKSPGYSENSAYPSSYLHPAGYHCFEYQAYIF